MRNNNKGRGIDIMGKSGKKDSPQTDVKTMAEFNSLLNNVSKEIK